MIFDVRFGTRELAAFNRFVGAVERLAAAHEKLASQDDPEAQADLDAKVARLREQNDQLENKVQGQTPPAP